MNSDVLPNPHNIPEARYRNTMSMLNTDGGLALLPDVCKEVATWNLASYLAFGHQLSNYVKAYDGIIDIDRPRYIIWTGKDNKNARRRVYETLDMLHGHMNLPAPKAWDLDGINAVVCETDPIFLKSSAANHLVLTFIRAAASRYVNDKVNTTNIQEFSWDLHKEDRDFFDRGAPGATKDSLHLKMAAENGNLKGLLDKTHCSLQRNGFDDWRVARNYDNNFPIWRGIVSYRPLEQNYAKIVTLDDVFKMHGFYKTNELDLIRKGEGYAGWKSTFNF